MDQQGTLSDRVRQRMASGEIELPVFDGAALEIHREARDKRLDAQRLCGLLERDATLVSEVLRMANSSFFAGLQEVRTLRDACVRLGVRQVAAIVFSVSQMRLYSASAGPYRSRFQALWQHASNVSIGARWLAIHSGRAGSSDEAFIVGLLHDIGKLYTLRSIEQTVREQAAGGGPAADAAHIDRALNELNREQGIRLLQHWNMPPAYIDIVTRLYDPPTPHDAPILAMVRLADRACAEPAPGDATEDAPGSASGGTSNGAADAVLLGLEADIVEHLRGVLEHGDAPGGTSDRAA